MKRRDRRPCRVCVVFCALSTDYFSDRSPGKLYRWVRPARRQCAPSDRLYASVRASAELRPRRHQGRKGFNGEWKNSQYCGSHSCIRRPFCLSFALKSQILRALVSLWPELSRGNSSRWKNAVLPNEPNFAQAIGTDSVSETIATFGVCLREQKSIRRLGSAAAGCASRLRNTERTVRDASVSERSGDSVVSCPRRV